MVSNAMSYITNALYVVYSTENLLYVTTKVSGAAVREGMSALARGKSRVIVSSSTMYMLTITYPCILPVTSQKITLFKAQCPSGVAREWPHRGRPLSVGSPLGDHCVPMNDVQGAIF